MMRVLRILAALAVLLGGATVLLAQNTAEQESRRAALQKEIAQLERQIEENTTKSSNALNELTLVRKQISSRRSLVEESEAEVRAISDSIALRQAEADSLQDRIGTMEQYYHRLVRNAYKNRDARVWYSYLLSSKDLGQASRRYAYLRDLSGQMNTQARKMKDMRAELEAELRHLDTLRRRAEAVKAKGLSTEDIQIWGVDGESKMLDYIEEGLCTGTIYTNADLQGQACAQFTMYAIGSGITAANLEATPIVKIAPLVVTGENVGDITEDMRW